MFFLSGDEAVKQVFLEEFLARRRGRTIVIFRDEKEIPDSKEGINLFAPYYEGSFGFDPALDILAGSSTINQAALNFAEALVTDSDIMSSRDPIWSYNSRGLFESLFIAGVQYWRVLHKNCAGQEKDLPSLTDTIFGMLDDLASSKIRNGDAGGKAGMSYPEWWSVAGIPEQEFLKTTVLGAPMNTAGSLLAVANSYTGGIMRLYSEDKSPLLFNPEWGENVFVYLPSVNAPALGVLLKTAKVAWGNELRVAACGASSWGKRSLAVLGDFFSENHFEDEDFLIIGTSPTPEILEWYSGALSWGAAASVAGISFFRAKVAETTGNPNGRLTALPAETPEECGASEWLRLNDSGWSLKSLDERALEEMKTRSHIVLRPAKTAQSEEIARLRTIFSDGACPPPFWGSVDGAIIIRTEDESSVMREYEDTASEARSVDNDEKGFSALPIESVEVVSLPEELPGEELELPGEELEKESEEPAEHGNPASAEESLSKEEAEREAEEAKKDYYDDVMEEFLGRDGLRDELLDFFDEMLSPDNSPEKGKGGGDE